MLEKEEEYLQTLTNSEFPKWDFCQIGVK